MIGTILDKYEVLQKVGEGGMATVYRGRHTTLDREVAIKVLHPHLSSSTRNRKRFAREARAIEQLRHQNILEIFDYSGSDTEDCYIVTEFVTGETLTELMNRCGRLPSEVVAMIGIHLAEALAFAHGQAVLHRDLKPDNVMIRADGTVKLMDFGIARFLDESQVTMTGALVGSPAYMSPEQANEGDLDPRSDLFSLGTVLYFLVAGQLPFSGSNPSLILKNIIEGNRPGVTELAPSMSASLADVIERLMQTDREARFNSASEIVEPLRKALEEVGVDMERPEWSLHRFVEDPDSWHRRLDEHLRAALLEHGKGYLAEGDHLSALRLFNRLLSIDDENPEVLALVQGLHTEPDSATTSRSKRRVAGRILVAAAVGLAAITAFGVYLVGGRHDPIPVAPTEAIGGAVAEVVASPTPIATAPAPIGPREEPAMSLPPVVTEVAPKGPVRQRAVLPPTARPPDAAALPVADGPARVTFLATPKADWAFAEVFCNNTRVGTTREASAKTFEPGAHQCRYTGEHILEDSFTLSLFPGEEQTVTREVRVRPLEIPLEASCPGACTVSVDGHEVGTVDGLGRLLLVREGPDELHTVRVACVDNAGWTRTFNGRSGKFSCAP